MTLLVSVLGFGATVWAQGGVQLIVDVQDPTGAAITYAFVQTVALNNTGSPVQEQFTDRGGRAAVTLSPGVYTLRVGGWPFKWWEREIDIRSDHELPVRLAIDPIEAGYQGPGPFPILLGPETRSDVAQSSAAPAATATDLLTVRAGTGPPETYTLATLKDLPRQTVTIFDHHTKANETYSGVPLMDLLARLGVPHGEALHGKALTDYVVATGSDGYKSVVTLAEIDPEFHPGMVLVADAMDGKPLGATGPFRLIVSENKRPARSVRNLVSIELKAAE